MENYENSIRCEYCGRYNADIDRCYFHNHPKQVCSYFKLSDDETLSRIMYRQQCIQQRKKAEPLQRADGSYIVTLDDTPKLKKKLDRQLEWLGLSGELIPAFFYLVALGAVLYFLWPLIADILEILEALGDLLH